MDLVKERDFMQSAVALSRKAYDDKTGAVPRVGALAVINDEIVAQVYRNYTTGEHAEFILLEKTDPPRSFVGTTVYTTLEPCTERGTTREGKKKIPCVEHLVRHKVGRDLIP